jgi:hypothetical protein
MANIRSVLQMLYKLAFGGVRSLSILRLSHGMIQGSFVWGIEMMARLDKHMLCELIVMCSLAAINNSAR